MSVTPSLKDKVEFTLDNRQIFFLFFGLSVVGCFVFAMGVMVGRRGELQELPAVAQVQQSALTEGEAPVIADAFSFKDGLRHPATEGLPETRDPQTPPRNEDDVRAEREAALGKNAGKKPGATTRKLPPIPAPGSSPAIASASKVVPPLAGGDAPSPAVVKAPEPTPAAPMTPPAAAIVEKSKDSLLTAVKGDAAVAGPISKANKRGYTLQMKAFSSPEDAEKLADRLRRNGHDVRVEAGEANGRTWHRVRMGSFMDWDAAVAAKAAFEKNEQVIAYVVSL